MEQRESFASVVNSELSGAPFVVVGIGASAGGLDVYERFFDAMPADSGAAFVLVQHLAPHHESILTELLAGHTQMVVSQIIDGVRLAPNHVYLIPPNTALALASGRLWLSDASETLRVPIDGFFASLASELREHAVAIVLSGTGADGALGVRAVKEHGGMTMAQDPTSARADGMPRSAIATGCVDHVVPVQAMPAILSAHLRRFGTPSSLDEPHEGQSSPRDERVEAAARSAFVRAACALLEEKTGHDFKRYKEASLGRRMARRMQLMQPPSDDAYLLRLRTDPVEVELLLKDVLINVTQFFRDPSVFEHLGHEIIPKLFAGKSEGDSLRVWVPGCASGEEAYSIAMLLAEHAKTLAIVPELKIFATDIDEDALSEARRGRYSVAAVAGISPERLERFFKRDGDQYEVTRALRDMCVFAKHNLVNNPPFSRLDLISCRNTLIYLRADLQNELLVLLHYALVPGGHLLLGLAESGAARPELFGSVSDKQRIFRRREPLVPSVLNFPVGERSAMAPTRPFVTPEQGRRSVKTVERILLEKYVAASAVVGERGEVLYLAGPTGRYLEQSTGPPTLNLMDMARPELRLELRGAIQEAQSTRAEIVRKRAVLRPAGELHPVDITVRPLPELGTDAKALLVTFSDAAGEAGASTTASAAADGDDAVAGQLAREMERTRLSLLATIDERQASNEQLQTVNEELLSMNEEMASTNEELQTSREEMQSINEELQTLAGELRQRISQLDAANGDLRNIFASSHIATVFLDANLRIKRFTPAAKEIFCLVASDVDRSIGDIMPRFTGGDLMPTVAEVLRTLEPREREVHRKEDDRWYAERVQPYRSVDDVVVGVVVTFVDITDRKRRSDDLEKEDLRKNEFLAMLAHELRNPLLPIRNAAYLLRELEPSGPGAEDARETIERQVGHMVHMIDDLLDVARVKQGKIRLKTQRVDLVGVVRRVLDDVQETLTKGGLKLTLDLPEAPMAMMGDATRLSQIVGNLVNNAGKFTDRGGAVRVRLWAAPDGETAVLVVEDTGVGMDAEMLPRVFEIFSQADRSLDRSRGGLGLGLSLVKGLVVQHGGTVRAESEGPGHGSRFIVELPLSHDRFEAEHLPVPRPVDAAATPKRILVVEDNEDAGVTMKLLLQRWGHRVEVARDAAAAFAAARRFQPEIVFCDIGLPGEMDGYAFARGARDDGDLRSAYLVALTGYGRDEDKALSREAGFNVHMTKPTSREDLERVLAMSSVVDEPGPWRDLGALPGSADRAPPPRRAPQR